MTCGGSKMNKMIRDTIGKQYLEGQGFIDHTFSHVQEAFAEINKVNRELFDMIPYQVYFTEEDMYTSAKHMREEVQRTGVIYIYSGWSGHPILTQEENNIGRAVHDVFAHCVCGCPFTFEGEYTAYLEQRKYYPEWTWDVLFAEIPAQTAAFYVNNSSHDFAQKAIAAPAIWVFLANGLELADYSDNSILPSLLETEVKPYGKEA
jgi:hypothetical protein